MAMDVKKQRICSVPNMLSMTRLVLVPVLIGLAFNAKAQAFLTILAVSLLSDVFDGYLARKLNQTTDLGAKLDSWGDVLTYGAMILGLYWIWPQIFADQLWFLVAATLSFVVPVAHALFKFGEYPSYHTLGAKTAAVLMAPAFYSLTLLGWDLFFQSVIVFHIVVAFEEMAITSVLRQPQTDVRSILSVSSYAQLQADGSASVPAEEPLQRAGKAE
jgi:phosphatidylglycerophosphate synthase